MIEEAFRPAVLIFDQDEELRQLLITQVKSPDYQIFQAGNYKDALALIANPWVSVVVTDVRIPEITLSDFIKRAREIRPEDLAILVLANPGSATDHELILKAGADEILAKPFERSNINTKIRLLLKRIHLNFASVTERVGRLTFKDLIVDIKSYDVFSMGERVKLTPNEFKLLQALLEHLGRILSRDRLIELVQGEGVAVIDRAVDTHIFSLRKKLGKIGECIQTIRGEGYRLKD